MRTWTLFLCFVALEASAQHQKNSFYCAPSVGLCIHQSVVPEGQATAGISFNRRVDLGLGLGTDAGGIQSTSLFMETKTYLLNLSNHNVFAYANGGINHPGAGALDASGFPGAYLKNGYFADAGFGCTLTNRKRPLSLFITAGYGLKSYARVFAYTDFQSGLQGNHSYTYHFHRINLRLGLRMGR